VAFFLPLIPHAPPAILVSSLGLSLPCLLPDCPVYCQCAEHGGCPMKHPEERMGELASAYLDLGLPVLDCQQLHTTQQHLTSPPQQTVQT